MRQILIIICFFMTSGLFAQNVIERSQYWFNNNFDGAVTEDVATPAALITFSESISTSHLSDGLHTFHIRFQDNENKWSTTKSSFFYKVPHAEITDNNIEAYEFWFNNNYDEAEYATTESLSVISLNKSIDVDNLSNGLHTFHIRFKDSSGKWSSILSSFFYKTETHEFIENSIVKYQYWLNNDFDNAVTADANDQQTFTLNQNIDFSDQNYGLHTFHIRFKDSSGKWSSILSSFFYKTETHEFIENSIVEYQYWLNNDFDNAVTADANDQQTFTLNQNIDFSDQNDGLHTFHIRFKDDMGKWSVIQSSFFYKIPVSEITENKITSYRYWINDDFDQGTVAELDEPVNPFNLISLLDIINLTAGDHYINLQFRDNKGVWSSVLTEEFSAPNPVIVSIEDVDNIEVSYGTAEEDAINELDPETVIFDSFNNAHIISLSWSIDSYNGELPGNYSATGTFELPDGIDQSEPETELEVTATVTVLNPFIVSIEDVDDIEVDFGTSETDAISLLAEKTTIADSAGEEHEVDLTWSIENYDAETAGNYTANGTFELPDGVIQSEPETELEVSANVKVLEPLLFELSLEANPVAGGSTSGSGNYIEGEEVTITAAPNEGWQFINWTIGEDTEVSNTAEFVYSMPGQNITLTANFEDVTGIAETVKHDIRIYPNPASKEFTIKAGFMIDQVLVIDNTGNTIYSTTVKDKEIKIFVQSFKPGAYYLRIHSENSVFTEKIIVQ